MKPVDRPAPSRSLITPPRAAAVLIVLVGCACYANSLHGEFLFDDRPAVVENRALRHVWPPGEWFSFAPPRALVYFTFAVNRAVNGDDPVGYHVVNIAIHIATALVLFGLIRRTLRLPRTADRYRRSADWFAAAAALVWVAHPLCTQAVTYVYQRLESLAACLAVVSLYGFVRAYGEGPKPTPKWRAVSLAACYAAMLSKESVIALPVIVLCYDRLFLAGSWRDVAQRRYFHFGMFASWSLAIALMLASNVDYENAGIGTVPGLNPLTYALSQSGVILHYFKLSVLPTGLCIDHLWPIADEWHEFVPQTVVVLSILALTFYGLYRGQAWSFPLLAFFFLLAPSSSIIPIADLIFEHRMYLPLACVVVLLGCAVVELGRRIARVVHAEENAARLRVGRVLGGAAFAAVVVALAYGTIDRNRDYNDAVRMWIDTAAKAPNNYRASYTVAWTYFRRRNFGEARRWLDEALRINPHYSTARIRLAGVLVDDGRLDEAEACLKETKPFVNERVTYRTAWGNLRTAQKNYPEAIESYLAALELNPMHLPALAGLGRALAEAGRPDEAAAVYREALTLEPTFAAVHANLGLMYAASGRTAEAAEAFRDAIRFEPQNAEARSNLGVMLDRLGRGDEALAELRRAAADAPEYPAGLVNLGSALARRGQFAEAVRYLEQAVRLAPTNETALANLAQARLDLQSTEAAPKAAIAAP